MKRKYNAGYSLIEILVAIVVLGMLVVPACTGLVMSVKINTRTNDMMQAQLAVSSAVETLMAEGIADTEPETAERYMKEFPDVRIEIEAVKDDGENPENYFRVTVTSRTLDAVSVETYIRQAEPTEPAQGEEGDA